MRADRNPGRAQDNPRWHTGPLTFVHAPTTGRLQLLCHNMIGNRIRHSGHSAPAARSWFSAIDGSVQLILRGLQADTQQQFDCVRGLFDDDG
jgi:hypothetical protein